MFKSFFIALVVFLSSCSTVSTYYIVRHAEKEPVTNMSTDVPLSSIGKTRAMALQNQLKDKKIQRIFSTNYIRTKSTAQPLSEAIGKSIETYDARDTSFVSKLKLLGKGSYLIVGHSNTVDDLVNGLTNENLLQDLPDTQYGDLFIVKKKNNQYSLRKSRFGN